VYTFYFNTLVNCSFMK